MSDVFIAIVIVLVVHVIFALLGYYLGTAGLFHGIGWWHIWIWGSGWIGLIGAIALTIYEHVWREGWPATIARFTSDDCKC
jgi:hypothetical protein